MNDTEKLRELWSTLCDVRQEIGQRCSAQAATWVEDDSIDRETRERLWREYEALCREWDIADARANVARARHVVAKYNLNESDVFDVE